MSETIQPPQAGHTALEPRVRELEERLAAVRLLAEAERAAGPPVGPALPLLLGLSALLCGYMGLGLPQHYYQPLFAALVLGVGYHRGVWLARGDGWRWPLVLLNFLVLCLMFKLFIGGGTSYPFDWMQVPAVSSTATEEGSWFQRAVPSFSITWEGIPGVSDWHFDLTQVQTVLLIATLVGAAFQFQPFASFTAVLLLIVSVPTFTEFNWDWVIPFLVLAAGAVYLQAPGRE
jgi:hypothetical protein